MAKSKKKQGMRLTKKVKNPKYTVYTDGGCARNPGGPGGIGIVIINNETGQKQEISKGFRKTTNNRMEIMAVLEGLKRTEEGATIRLYSDSQYTLYCMSGTWEMKKNLDLWKVLIPLQNKRSVELNWIKGHSNNRLNERCDTLATAAMKSKSKEADIEYEKEAAKKSHEIPNVQQHRKRNADSMAVRIKIPEELRDKAPQITNSAEYEKQFKVNPMCADAICTFYNTGDRKIESYKHLQTGGLDPYSRKKLDEIALSSSDPELYIATIRKYLHGEKDADYAARWNARGLSLYDSIRKALINREIRISIIGKQ